MPITYSNVGGAIPSTIDFRAATVVIARGTTNEQQEIIVLGDPQSSLNLARILANDPVSTEFGLVVRIAGGPSSAVDLKMRPVFSSSNADNPVRAVLSSTAVDNPVRPVFSSSSADNPVRAVLSSTSTDNPVRIDGNSTVIQGTTPWQIAGNSTVLILAGNSSVIITAGNSSVIITSGNSSVFQGQSPWITASIMQSSLAASSNSSGVIVRQVVDAILTTASSNAFASTSLVLQSSAAGIRSYVTAYSITSTVQTPTKVGFYSAATLLWPVVLAAFSSAVTGVNLACSAPAYLFRTAVADPLTVQVPSSVAGFKVGVSYFRAP